MRVNVVSHGFPTNPPSQVWKQTTNPVTTVSSVQGYEAVDVHFTTQYWGGLENGFYKGGSNPEAFLDGSVDQDSW